MKSFSPGLLFVGNLKNFFFFFLVHSPSCVWPFVTPRTTVCQAFLSLLSPGVCSHSCPLSQWCHWASSSSVAPSPPVLRVFSSQLTLSIMWPKYWSFSFSISPSNNIQGWFPLRLTGLLSLLSQGLSGVFSSTAIQKHQFFSAQPFFMFQL